MQVEQSTQQTPIFVYYSFRGLMQPFRNLLSYLDQPYLEVHLDKKEQQRKTLPLWVFRQVSRFKLDSQNLPALIHGEHCLQGLTVIAYYLCMRFGHQELLGSTIFLRAQVREIMEIYVQRHPISMIKMLSFADKASSQTQIQIAEGCPTLIHDIWDTSGYVLEIAQYIDIHHDRGYIFGEITVIDFFYMQSSQYALGVFGRDDRIRAIQHEKSPPHIPKTYVYYLEVLANYVKFIKEQPWYQRQKSHLESFSIISAMLTPQRIQGMRRIWVGNPYYVS